MSGFTSHPPPWGVRLVGAGHRQDLFPPVRRQAAPVHGGKQLRAVAVYRLEPSQSLRSRAIARLTPFIGPPLTSSGLLLPCPPCYSQLRQLPDPLRSRIRAYRAYIALRSCRYVFDMPPLECAVCVRMRYEDVTVWSSSDGRISTPGCTLLTYPGDPRPQPHRALNGTGPPPPSC